MAAWWNPSTEFWVEDLNATGKTREHTKTGKMSTRRTTRRTRSRANDSDAWATGDSATETDTEHNTALVEVEGEDQQTAGQDERVNRGDASMLAPARAQLLAADTARDPAGADDAIAQETDTITALQGMMTAQNVLRSGPNTTPNQQQRGSPAAERRQEDEEGQAPPPYGDPEIETDSEWYAETADEEQEGNQQGGLYANYNALLQLDPQRLYERREEAEEVLAHVRPKDATILRNRLAVAAVRAQVTESNRTDDRGAARVQPIRPTTLPTEQRARPRAQTTGGTAPVQQHRDVTHYLDLPLNQVYARAQEIMQAVTQARPQDAMFLLGRLQTATYEEGRRMSQQERQRVDTQRTLGQAAAEVAGQAESQAMGATLTENQSQARQGPTQYQTQRSMQRATQGPTSRLTRGSTPPPMQRPIQQTTTRRTGSAPPAAPMIAGYPVARNTALLSHRPYASVARYPDVKVYDTDTEPPRVRERRLAYGIDTEEARRRHSLPPGAPRQRRKAKAEYNPMRIRSPMAREYNQTRRQARRALYDAAYGPPAYDDYPSSDTDWSEEYTTEQEDIEKVEKYFAGDVPSDEDDWRLWPWPKMRKALKEVKRRYTANDRSTDKRAITTTLERTPRNLNPVAREYVRRLQDELIRHKQKIRKHEEEFGETFAEAKERGLEAGRRQAARLEAANAVGDTDSESRHGRGRITGAPTKISKAIPRATTEIPAFLPAPEAYRQRMAECARKQKGKPRSRLTVQHVTPEPTIPSTRRKREVLPSSDDDSEESEAETIARAAPVAATTSRSAMSAAGGDHGRMTLEVPTFTGDNWPTFLNQFERVAEHLEWTPEDKAVHLHNAIRGEAANALSSAESKKMSYEKLVEHMELRHGKTRSHGDVLLELMATHRRVGQTLASWHDQVIAIVNTGNMTPEQADATAFYGFVYGLRGNSSMYTKVSQAPSQTIGEAFKMALKWERANGTRAYGLPAGVNMVANEDAELKEAIKKRPNEAGLLAKQKAQQPLTMNTLADLAQQLGTRIDGVGEKLSERFDKRFDDLSGRVTHLETQVNKRGDEYRPKGAFNNNNAGQNRGFNNGNGGYNRGYNNGSGGGYRRNFNNNRGGYRREDPDRREYRDEYRPRDDREDGPGRSNAYPNNRANARQQAGQYRNELKQQGGASNDSDHRGSGDVSNLRSTGSGGSRQQQE